MYKPSMSINLTRFKILLLTCSIYVYQMINKEPALLTPGIVFFLAGHNVVLLANHQTEADPGVFALSLEKTHPKLATDVIYVAGGQFTNRTLGPVRCFGVRDVIDRGDKGWLILEFVPGTHG